MTPHTSLRALLFFAFGIFLTSTFLVTLLPAYRLREVPGLPGAPALKPEALWKAPSPTDSTDTLPTGISVAT